MTRLNSPQAEIFATWFVDFMAAGLERFGTAEAFQAALAQHTAEKGA